LRLDQNAAVEPQHAREIGPGQLPAFASQGDRLPPPGEFGFHA